MSGKNILSVLAVCGFCSLSAESAAASDCCSLFARPPFKLLEIEAENLEFGPGESITAKTALGGSQYTLYLGKRNLTLVRANDSKRTGVDVVLAK